MSLIVVAYPTVQDGLVMRWYGSEAAALDGSRSELMSVSRNGIRISGYLHDVPDSELQAATVAWAILRRGGPDDTVRAMATHRVIGLINTRIEPITPTDSGPGGPRQAAGVMPLSPSDGGKVHPGRDTPEEPTGG